MKRAILETLNAARDAGRPVALATRLDDGAQALVENGSIVDGALEGSEGLIEAAAGVLRTDSGTSVELGGQRIFIQPFNPPLRLIIIGAVHIAQPLATMAIHANYAVTVVDPRGAFATTERFPDVDISQEWPDDALEELKPDTRTAIVALTHDPKIDDPGLLVALDSPCFYIAALGSRKTHAARLVRLAEQGVSSDNAARIHGPAGLSISAKSPPEIAISIMAEMTGVLRSTPAPQKADKAA